MSEEETSTPRKKTPKTVTFKENDHLSSQIEVKKETVVKKEKKTKEEIKNDRVRIMKTLKESDIKKRRKTNSNINKYHNIIARYKDCIRSNLKKNTRNKIRRIIGVRQIEKGATSLLASVGIRWIADICRDLKINYKYSENKMITSDLIALTIKNSIK